MMNVSRSLEDPMVALKALSLVVAGFLSLLAVGFMVREMQAVKVKARTPQNRHCLLYTSDAADE